METEDKGGMRVHFHKQLGRRVALALCAAMLLPPLWLAPAHAGSFEMALQHHRNGSYEQALRYFRQAAVEDAGNPNVMLCERDERVRFVSPPDIFRVVIAGPWIQLSALDRAIRTDDGSILPYR